MTSLSDKIRQQYEQYPYPRRRPKDFFHPVGCAYLRKSGAEPRS